jgi:ribosomal protein L7Ae-like RNA K-turn-binding protein
MSGSMTPLMRALGLCARARGLIFGVPMICESMRVKEKPKLVLMACDVSENTRKRLQDKCTFYSVQLLSLPIDTATLAHVVGKSASLGAVALSDENFCRLVTDALEKENAARQPAPQSHDTIAN